MEMDALRTLGLNPTHALQHPGFYYYMAARCTEMRRERFLSAVDAEVRTKLSDQAYRMNLTISSVDSSYHHINTWVYE